MLEHSDYEPDYETFLAEDRLIGDDGLATPSGPLTPLQQLLQHDMRIETTVYSLADEPEVMEELFDVMHRLNLKAYRIIAESPAEVSFTYEDTSTTVINRSMYQNYCAPQLDEYTDILHSGGKVSIVHMCGKLKASPRRSGAGKMDGHRFALPAHHRRFLGPRGPRLLGRAQDHHRRTGAALHAARRRGRDDPLRGERHQPHGSRTELHPLQRRRGLLWHCRWSTSAA